MVHKPRVSPLEWVFRLAAFPSFALLLLVPATAQSAPHIAGYNYDEASIPPYTLLDPLALSDGVSVQTPAMWWQVRRPQILQLFAENIFGHTPPDAVLPVRAHLVESDRSALNGLAIRKQIDLSFTDAGPTGPHMRLLLYLPAAKPPRAVVLGLNFEGNQAVLDDPAILPSPVWSKPRGSSTLEHLPPPESTRGKETEEWQVRRVLARGYGLATVYYGDLEPDFKDASQFSVRALFQKPGTAPAPDSWGAIGAWAWGLSRALDYLQTDPDVAGSPVAVTGHSRLAKAADWAAAQDTRFAAVLSTESGKAGQSLSRRELGETVYHLQHSFPYWFCANYAEWVGKDQQIPADGNLLLSLVAPRPLYVASAQGDEWSDPHGEFLSLLSASRVYRLLGAKALATSTPMPMPGPDQPVTEGVVAYHMRTGKHDVTAYDWEQYLNFLDRQLPATRLPATAGQVDLWRRQIRAALFIPDPLPTPEPARFGSFAVTPDVIAERVTYRTSYGLRVPAIVYRPAHPPAGKLPGLVLVNGHGADKSSWYSYYTGIVYARGGAVVVTYDPIGEGERNDDHKDATGEHDRVIDLPTLPARMGGLMVTDILQAVSYLITRPEVDRRRIGVLGFSMGSFEAVLAGAVDPRIHALLLTGGGDLDGPGGYWDSSHAVMCQSGPYKALNFLGDRPAVLLTLNARRGDTFLLNGTADTVVDIPNHGPDFFAALRQRVVARNGSDKGVFTTSFDNGASHRPNWMTPTAAEWLGRELQLPLYPRAKIASLPSEPMRTWAASVGYPLGKSSGREDRDAGLPVLVAGVPLLTPEQLDVLSRAVWEQRKADFIYSSWVAAAEKAAAALQK